MRDSEGSHTWLSLPSQVKEAPPVPEYIYIMRVLCELDLCAPVWLWPQQNVDLIDGLRDIDLYNFIYKPVYIDKAGKTCGIEQVVLLVDSLRLGVIQVSPQQPRILEI